MKGSLDSRMALSVGSRSSVQGLYDFGQRWLGSGTTAWHLIFRSLATYSSARIKSIAGGASLVRTSGVEVAGILVKLLWETLGSGVDAGDSSGCGFLELLVSFKMPGEWVLLGSHINPTFTENLGASMLCRKS